MHDQGIAAFADPARFDAARPPAALFHFGLGLHECLGRPIGAAMIPEIVRQCLLIPGLGPVGCPDHRGGAVPESWRLVWPTG